MRGLIFQYVHTYTVNILDSWSECKLQYVLIINQQISMSMHFYYIPSTVNGLYQLPNIDGPVTTFISPTLSAACCLVSNGAPCFLKPKVRSGSMLISSSYNIHKILRPHIRSNTHTNVRKFISQTLSLMKSSKPTDRFLWTFIAHLPLFTNMIVVVD